MRMTPSLELVISRVLSPIEMLIMSSRFAEGSFLLGLLNCSFGLFGAERTRKVYDLFFSVFMSQNWIKSDFSSK